MKSVIYFLALPLIFAGFLSSALAGAVDEGEAEPAPLPRMKDPALRTMDDVKSFFLRGIVANGPRRSPAKNGRPKQNRIYTVGELKAKFGEPQDRKQGVNEAWTFQCADGKVFVSFTAKGYGGYSGPGAENRLRLQANFAEVALNAQPVGGRRGRGNLGLGTGD